VVFLDLLHRFLEYRCNHHKDIGHGEPIRWVGRIAFFCLMDSSKPATGHQVKG